jgi:hypothetical protein
MQEVMAGQKKGRSQARHLDTDNAQDQHMAMLAKMRKLKAKKGTQKKKQPRKEATKTICELLKLLMELGQDPTRSRTSSRSWRWA